MLFFLFLGCKFSKTLLFIKKFSSFVLFFEADFNTK